VSSSFPRAGFASSSRPETKPAPAAPKPEPKPAPVSAFKPAPQAAPQPAPQPAPAAFKPAPQPEPKPEKTAVPQPEPQPAPVVIAKPEPKAVPKTQQLITTPQPGNLPKDTCYNADGKLTWFYRDLEKDPAGNFVIKFVFEEDHIANYEGIDITSQAMADAQVSIRYYYKRVTVVERHAETGWIFFRHGIDRYFLKVSSDQMEFILDEFMKRCPSSKFGVVKQW
jgi:outer membrane biosynthesis protein TonB